MTGSLEVQLSNALHQRDEARRERDDAESRLALKQRAADEAVDRALELARQLAEVRTELGRFKRAYRGGRPMVQHACGFTADEQPGEPCPWCGSGDVWLPMYVQTPAPS